MATMAQLRYSPLAAHFHNNRLNHLLLPTPKCPLSTTCSNSSSSATFSPSQSALLFYNSFSSSREPKFLPTFAAGGDSGSIGGNRGFGGGGGPPDDSDSSSSPSNSSSDGAGFGPIGAFLSGWRSRVAADPQFPFKVLMEELVGVTACVLGDMASRPNFGLNELDFVFSTLVVGSILNFVLMYLLAPTAGAGVGASSSGRLPSIFATCPPSHMFQPGAYGVLSRMGTFVYKGTLFAAVGFAAGLVGTAISNALIKMRKKMDPNFQTPNKPPPTLLNALTWAAHMGVSSNFRYQTLNGIEFLLAKGLPPLLFKSSVVVLRCLNNVLGGMSFVVLARLTGSQAAAAAAPPSSSAAAELEQEQQQLLVKEVVGAREGSAGGGDALPADKDKLVNGGTGTGAKQY